MYIFTFPYPYHKRIYSNYFLVRDNGLCILATVKNSHIIHTNDMLLEIAHLFKLIWAFNIIFSFLGCFPSPAKL